MELTRVLNPKDLFYVMLARNECREFAFYNKDRKRIGIGRNTGLIIKYLFGAEGPIFYVLKNNFNESVGWGEIRYDHYLNPWIAGGINRYHRGNGYGKQLFRYLSEEWHMPVFCQILENNEAAKHLLMELGFQVSKKEIVDGRSTIIMRKEWH